MAALVLSLGSGASSLSAEASPPATPAVSEAEDSVVTQHELRLDGKTIVYRAQAGTLTLRGGTLEPHAKMFYVAYEVSDRGPKGRRPVTFFFNGGPGSSSLWLHIGAFGPQRLALPAPDEAAAPPAFGPNPFSLLNETDLVYLDAIGTGLSRTVSPGFNKDYFGNDEDADAFTEAIGRYLTVSGRWGSPIFLFGESYGAMRVAMLSKRLAERGVGLTGLLMMSSILNFGHFAKGLDQQALDLLPSYAATALYHHRIAPYAGGVEALTRDVRNFARGPYAAALAKGDLIADDEKTAIAQRLHGFIGLSVDYIERADLRVSIDQFRRELLRDERRSVGSMDTRFAGFEATGIGEQASYDPSEAALAAPFTAAFNSYLDAALHYVSRMPYVVADTRTMMGQWDWSHRLPDGDRQGSLADSVPDLATAMQRDPKVRVLSLNGWYDLMTPFFGTEFDLARLSLGKGTAERVSFRYYPSGHMIYVDDRVMPTLRRDILDFYERALAQH